MGSLYFFFLGVISYLKPFWNVVACVLFSPFVYVCRRFFSSFTLTPNPLAAVVSTFIDHRLQRQCGEITKRAENHYIEGGWRGADDETSSWTAIRVWAWRWQIVKLIGDVSQFKNLSSITPPPSRPGLLLFLSFIRTKKCQPIDLLRFLTYIIIIIFILCIQYKRTIVYIILF